LDSKFDYMKKTICIKNLLRFKIWLHGKATWIKKILIFKNWLDGKIACIEKLLGFKNWLYGKNICSKKATLIEKMFGSKKFLSWKIVCKENFSYWKKNYIEISIYIEKLLVHWTTCIENLLRFQILVILKNHFKHSKRGN